jgi:transposase
MTRFICGADRRRITLLLNQLDDHVSEDNSARVVEMFVDELDLATLGFNSLRPAATSN